MLIVHEALGLTCKQVLDSSYIAIEAMMQEYAYICYERRKLIKSNQEESDGGEWIELPSWDNPGKTVRMKKYYDISDKINI